MEIGTKMSIRIEEVQERNSDLIEQLLKIWETSVKETHLFLSDKERDNIKKYVPQALNHITHLIIMENDSKFPIAFMGVAKQKLEMLFISPEARGNGFGKKLIRYGIEHDSIHEVAVNEQNILAKGFYEHMGFQVYKRTALDEQGNPYPLLYMKLSS